MGLEKPVIKKTVTTVMEGNKVKHIQRGTIGSFDSNSEKTIALTGFTDVSKMVAIIDGDTHANNSSTYVGVYVKSLTVDSLVLGSAHSNGICLGSYQVIEFD